MELFQKLNREREITIVLVTHEADIAEYATRVIGFRDGRVRLDQAVVDRRDAVDELSHLDASAEALSA